MNMDQESMRSNLLKILHEHSSSELIFYASQYGAMDESDQAIEELFETITYFLNSSDIEAIAPKIPATCISLLNEGRISGRESLYILSEIRGWLMNTFLKYAPPNKRSLAVTIAHIRELYELCVAPLKNATDVDVATPHAPLSCPCMELLPVLFGILKELNSHVKSQHIQFSTSDAIDEILNHLPWSPASAIFVVNILCDLYPFLRSKHMEKMKTKILSAINVFKVDDLATVIRVCLQMQSHTGDVGWYHVVRLLYRNIPHGSVGTLEAVLDQIMTQNTVSCYRFLDVLENTAIQMIYGSLAATGENEEKEEEGQSGTDPVGVIPVPTVHDIRLFLMLERARSSSTSCGSSSNVGGGAGGGVYDFPLPAILFSSQLLDESHKSNSNNSNDNEDRYCRILISLACSIVCTGSPTNLSQNYASSSSSSSSNRDALPSCYTICKNVVIRSIFTDNVSSIVQGHPGSPSLSSSLSSSGSLWRHEINWTTSVRALQIVKYCLACSASPQCLHPVMNLMERVQHHLLVPNRRGTVTETETVTPSPNRHMSSNGSTDAVTVADRELEASQSQSDELLSEMLGNIITEIFVKIDDSQSCIISLLIRGLVASSTQVLSATTCNQINGYQYRRLTSCQSCLVFALNKICVDHPLLVATHSCRIQSMLSSIIVLPSAVLRILLPPLIPVAVISSTLFDSIHGCLKKCLLDHLDRQRRQFAVETLVHLLVGGNEASQTSIMTTLLYAFSFPPDERGIVYLSLSRLLRHSDDGKRIYKSVLYLLQIRLNKSLSNLCVESEDTLVIVPSKSIIHINTIDGVRYINTECVGSLISLSWIVSKHLGDANERLIAECLEELTTTGSDTDWTRCDSDRARHDDEDVSVSLLAADSSTSTVTISDFMRSFVRFLSRGCPSILPSSGGDVNAQSAKDNHNDENVTSGTGFNEFQDDVPKNQDDVGISEVMNDDRPCASPSPCSCPCSSYTQVHHTFCYSGICSLLQIAVDCGCGDGRSPGDPCPLPSAAAVPTLQALLHLLRPGCDIDTLPLPPIDSVSNERHLKDVSLMTVEAVGLHISGCHVIQEALTQLQLTFRYFRYLAHQVSGDDSNSQNPANGESIPPVDSDNRHGQPLSLAFGFASLMQSLRFLRSLTSSAANLLAKRRGNYSTVDQHFSWLVGDDGRSVFEASLSCVREIYSSVCVLGAEDRWLAAAVAEEKKLSINRREKRSSARWSLRKKKAQFYGELSDSSSDETDPLRRDNPFVVERQLSLESVSGRTADVAFAGFKSHISERQLSRTLERFLDLWCSKNNHIQNPKLWETILRSAHSEHSLEISRGDNAKESSTWHHTRGILFFLREVSLRAEADIISVLRDGKRRRRRRSKREDADTDLDGSSSCRDRSIFIARELTLATQEGLPLRTMNAYLALLHTLYATEGGGGIGEGSMRSSQGPSMDQNAGDLLMQLLGKHELPYPSPFKDTLLLALKLCGTVPMILKYCNLILNDLATVLNPTAVFNEGHVETSGDDGLMMTDGASTTIPTIRGVGLGHGKAMDWCLDEILSQVDKILRVLSKNRSVLVDTATFETVSSSDQATENNDIDIELKGTGPFAVTGMSTSPPPEKILLQLCILTFSMVYKFTRTETLTVAKRHILVRRWMGGMSSRCRTRADGVISTYMVQCIAEVQSVVDLVRELLKEADASRRVNKTNNNMVPDFDSLIPHIGGDMSRRSAENVAPPSEIGGTSICPIPLFISTLLALEPSPLVVVTELLLPSDKTNQHHESSATMASLLPEPESRTVLRRRVRCLFDKLDTLHALDTKFDLKFRLPTGRLQTSIDSCLRLRSLHLRYLQTRDTAGQSAASNRMRLKKGASSVAEADDDSEDGNSVLDDNSASKDPVASMNRFSGRGSLLSNPSRGHKKRRIRSRNRTVDAWLNEFEGENIDEDTYADLEDFLV
eukprot:gene215-387_t